MDPTAPFAPARIISAMVDLGSTGPFAQADVDVDRIEDALPDGGLGGWDWVVAGAIVVVAIVVARALRWLVARSLGTRADRAVADLLGRLLGYLVVAFGLVYALEQVGVRIGPLLGALGVVGVAVAFALKDILENFVAGLLLQVRRPFSYGELIASGDVTGTVVGIDARSVTVRTPDGETVHLPSSQVINQPIVNLQVEGRRRSCLRVGVGYATDLDTAVDLLRGVLDDAETVRARPAPEVLVAGFGDSAIDVDLLFWHDPGAIDVRRAVDEVARAVHQRLGAAGIEIPYPQRVVTVIDTAGNDATVHAGDEGPDRGGDDSRHR